MNEPGPAWAKVLDVHMLTLFSGRQRTLLQYQALLESAGFTFQRKIDTTSEFSLIEATVV